MSKKDKEFQRLLSKKVLSSKEAVRLLELDGWFRDKNNSQTGTSHQHFSHLTKFGKVCVPAGREALPDKTKQSILKQAGLIS